MAPIAGLDDMSNHATDDHLRGQAALAASRSTHIAAVEERFLSGRCDRRGINDKCKDYSRTYRYAKDRGVRPGLHACRAY
jgi:hypothetical protein